jgi:hypothetical protein
MVKMVKFKVCVFLQNSKTFLDLMKYSLPKTNIKPAHNDGHLSGHTRAN